MRDVVNLHTTQEKNARICYDGFSKYFASAKDYRRQGSVQHKLIDILFITLCASISGANDISAIAEFAKTNEQWFTSYLQLDDGVPSESTFRTVFALLDPAPLSQCFVQWVQELADKSKHRVTAIDGKAQRRTGVAANSNSFIHLVSAWAAGSGITVGQLKVNGKSNEITAIPELLKIIDVEDSIVTIDAMGTQTKIAELIVEGKADYILALKGNQSTVHDEVMNYFDQALEHGELGIDFHVFEEVNSGHGRNETRRIYVTDQLDFLGDIKSHWRGLKTIACVDSERVVKGESSRERRYYISTLDPDPELIGNCIRTHWGIENKVH